MTFTNTAEAKAHYAKLIETVPSQLDIFRDVNIARSFCNRCCKGHAVIMLEDGLAAVTTLKLAARLEKLGYEFA